MYEDLPLCLRAGDTPSDIASVAAFGVYTLSYPQEWSDD